MVERHPHPTDRRVRTLWLTPVAWDVIERMLAINAVVREEACAGLNPEQRAAMVGALNHMKANLALGDDQESAAAE